MNALDSSFKKKIIESMISLSINERKIYTHKLQASINRLFVWNGGVS